MNCGLLTLFPDKTHDIYINHFSIMKENKNEKKKQSILTCSSSRKSAFAATHLSFM